MASDIGEEQLKAVGSARDRVSLVLRLRGLFFLRIRVGMRDLDAVRLELALKELGLFLAEIVFERERFELRGFEMASVLFSALDQRLQVLRLEQFDELVLRQLVFQSFRISIFRSDKLTNCMGVTGLFPG